MNNHKRLFPIVLHSESGVRIVPSTRLLLEQIAQKRAHRIDADPMLKAMRSSLRLLFIRARGSNKKPSETPHAIHKWNGDQKSVERLFEIHRLLWPEAHELTIPVERALDFRYLMCEISYLVTPANRNNKTILKGTVRLSSGNSQLNPDLYARAKSHWNKRTTLKSLAVRVFLDELGNRGITTIDEKRIDRDLAALRRWDQKKSGGKSPVALQIIFSTDESQPYQFHAQKWLKRKRHLGNPSTR